MNPKALLIKIWVGFGTFGGILSLASLFDSLIAWSEFVRQIIEAYRQVVDTIWAPLVYLFPFSSPRWLNDYLTICALSAIAVLWSLHQTSKELGFAKIGSTATAIWRMFFEFSLGKSALLSFRGKALDPAQLGHAINAEVERGVRHVARISVGFWNSVLAVLWILVLALVVFPAPYLLPVVMYFRDRDDMARAKSLLAARIDDIDDIEAEEAVRHDLKNLLKRQADSFAGFEAINALYYRTVLKHQFWYYAAVVVLFFCLVLINYLALRYAAHPA